MVPLRHLLFALLFLCSSPLLAQEVEFIYDNGDPDGMLQNISPGDVELVRMTTDAPVKLTKLDMHFAVAENCSANIFIWEDNGGNAPDLERIIYETTTTIEAPGWFELSFEEEVTIEPPRNFYVGHILQDPACQLSWTSSLSEENRSLARLGGNWYTIIDDSELPLAAVIRATGTLFNIREEWDFEDVTELAGLPTSMRRMAWGDYDNDDDDDLLVSGSRLYRNNGDETFTEVSEEAGIAGSPTNGGIWADYDNDGFLDFYASVSTYLPECETDDDCVWCTLLTNPNGSRGCDVMQYDHTCSEGRCMPPSGIRNHDLLWHNNGDGTFTEVSEEAGPFDFMPTEAVAWGDYDSDGYVDLYVANYETPQGWVQGNLSVGTPDFLWHNNGDGTFSEVSDTAGMKETDEHLCGRGIAWVDYDDDGDQDIYVANYRLQRNLFWQNQGDGTFVDVSLQTRTRGVKISGSYGHGIGASWADMDLDGDWDLFVANLAHPRFIEFSDKSMMYISSGAPDYIFLDIRESAGITYSETHSDPAWGDYNNDGFPDLFITDVYVGYKAFFYKNNGNRTFTDITYPSGINVDNGWGCAWSDYNNDGYLDLVSTTLWKNNYHNPGRHWLKIKLRGTESNAAAIGAIVTVTTEEQTTMQQVEGGKGTGNQNSFTLHFGLKTQQVAETVTIRWPSGLVETYNQVGSEQTLLFVEGEETIIPEIPEGTQPEPDQDVLQDDTSESGPEGDNSPEDILNQTNSDDGCGCHTFSKNSPNTILGFLFLLLSLGILISRRRGNFYL